MIGQTTRIAIFVPAVALILIGTVTKTSISAENADPPIEFELVPEQEPAMIDEIATLTVELQEKRKPLQGDEVLRGVHPKSHGCVSAKFTVSKYISSEYKVGLFSNPGTYDAMIRYSNAAVLLEPDLKDGENGSRGMAIKVLDVNKLPGANEPMLLMDDDRQNQDFLMINTAEFAFANVRDYLRLSRALNTNLGGKNEHGASPNLYFVPIELAALGQPTDTESAEVTRKRQTLKGLLKSIPVFDGFSPEDATNTKLTFDIIKKIKTKAVRNPLEVQYFSAAPFRYGVDRVMKYSVIPAAGEVPQEVFKPEHALRQDPNYLALALKESLTQGETIHLSLLVQTVEEPQLAGREKKMIENAATAWDEKEFPFVKVAHIAIAPVGEDEQLVDNCKALQFTPWHALAAHEPLGGINRLRKPVYCRSAIFRTNASENEDQELCQGPSYD